jgi:mono/diheme cytochrome c family protein
MKAGYVFIFCAVIVSGCNIGRNDPGWDFFPDMFYSTAYEPYSENPNFSNGMTMLPPVPGTVPRGYVPFEYTIDTEERAKAGRELVNPYKTSSELIDTGRNNFNIFCTVCHGNKGDGTGILFTSGLYPMKPRTLTGETAQKLKDGEIYHTITLGFGSMGSYGSQIRPEDRWKIVLFIRQLQHDSQANSDTLSVK